MSRKNTKSDAITFRAFVGNDRGYDSLNREIHVMEDRYTQLSIENSRNNLVLEIQAITEAQNNGIELTTEQIDNLRYRQSDELIEFHSALVQTRSIRDGIKNEKKLLEVMNTFSDRDGIHT